MLNLFNLNTFYTLVNDIFFEPLSQFEIISYSSNLVSFVFKDYYPELFYNVKPAYPFMVDYLEYLALRSEKVKIGKYLVPKAWLNFGLLNVLPSLYITQILRFRYAKMMDGDASFVLEKQNLLEKFLIFFNNINSSFFLLILILLLIFSFLKKKRNIFIISTS